MGPKTVISKGLEREYSGSGVCSDAFPSNPYSSLSLARNNLSAESGISAEYHQLTTNKVKK